MANLGSILKSRDITLSTKVYMVKSMVFPVVMDGCESWTVKMADHRRNDAFKQWCWRRLLRVPWTSGKSNQSILKKINPEYSLEGQVLKFQYFGHLLQGSDSSEKKKKKTKHDSRENRGQEKWTTGNEMVRQHH